MMTYIGMGALLVGCFMLVGGWQSGVKGKLMGQGAILIVAGACIGMEEILHVICLTARLAW